MTTRSRNGVIMATAGIFLMFACWRSTSAGAARRSRRSSAASPRSAVSSPPRARRTPCAGLGRQRTAWLCFRIGLAGWVVGNPIWAYYLIVTDRWPPFPSAADAFYLLCRSSSALQRLRPSTGGRAGIRALLDGLLVTASIFLMAWTIGLHAGMTTSRSGVPFVCRPPTHSPTSPVMFACPCRWCSPGRCPRSAGDCQACSSSQWRSS